MKLIGVVILYYPDIALLKINILSYINHIDKLIIWENTPTIDSYLSEIKQFEFSSKINIMGSGHNMGIAYALNRTCSYAKLEGYSWILTMDQDSSFNDNDFFDVFHKTDKNGVGIFCPVDGLRIYNINQNLPVNVDLAVTSGNIVNLNVYKQVGGFDEKLFIDGVDHDFCFKCTLQGYKIIQFQNILLNHKLGDEKEIKTFKGGIVTISFHSPQRTYYIFRNSFYLFAKYNKLFPDVIKNRKKSLLHELKHIILYSDSKFKKLQSILIAYIDYKRNKFGKKY